MNTREKKWWLRFRYPTTIIKDRYNGTYSNAEWLAFPMDFWDVPDEVEGGDGECMMFWDTYKEPVGKGDTPEDAYKDLILRMEE